MGTFVQRVLACEDQVCLALSARRQLQGRDQAHAPLEARSERGPDSHRERAPEEQGVQGPEQHRGFPRRCRERRLQQRQLPRGDQSLCRESEREAEGVLWIPGTAVGRSAPDHL